MNSTATKAMFLAFALAAAAISYGSDERGAPIHVTKDCSNYGTGPAGAYCTVTISSLPQIKMGSKVYYDQADVIPGGMLDSNVVLLVGTGDWAVGRCTLDDTTGKGLCIFTDGVGQMAGFHARVVVTPDANNPALFHWNGSYSFDIEP